MKNIKFILMIVVFLFLVTSCGGTHFGVRDHATFVPSEFDRTEAVIAEAERSEGAKYCPEKIAEAKELGREAIDVYWACHDKEAMDKLAQARDLAREAQECRPPAPQAKPAPPPPPPPPPPPAPKKEIVLKSITGFAFDRASIPPAQRAVLDDHEAVLEANPEVRVEIAGHTDTWNDVLQSDPVRTQSRDSLRLFLHEGHLLRSNAGRRVRREPADRSERYRRGARGQSASGFPRNPVNGYPGSLPDMRPGHRNYDDLSRTERG